MPWTYPTNILIGGDINGNVPTNIWGGYVVEYEIATRCRILRLKCTKFNFGAGGANSAPPDPLAGLRGPTSKGRAERDGEGVRWGGEGKGGERREQGRKEGGGVPPMLETR